MYAPIFVQGRGIELIRSRREEYQYPVQGWEWFESKEAASLFFEIPLEDNSIDLLAGLIRPSWSAWRKEMFSLPSFILLLQLIDQSLAPGVQSGWAIFSNLLFKVAEDPSVVSDLARLWPMISSGANISQETKEHWARIAEKHDLPEEFVAVIRT